MSTIARAAVLAGALAATLLLPGCGDIFRPVANPTLTPGGDPQRVMHMVLVTSNGGNPGAVSTIDVSGDTVMGTVSLGRGPGPAGALPGRVLVPNTADDTVSSYVSVTPTDPATIISLPVGSHPTFAGGTETNNAYVIELGTAQVAVISLGLNSVSTQLPVGANPVYLVETPDTKKVYVLNQGNGTVTMISTADLATNTFSVGTAPVWAAVSSDSSLLFVANQASNNVSVINTATNGLATTISVGAAPNYVFYDSTLKRVYVTNGVGNSVSVIDASTSTPTLMATVSEKGGLCSGTTPIGVTAIQDGTRAYVANQSTNNVCVLSTTSNTFIRSIPTQGINPVSVASSADGSKVFVANSGSGNVTAIQTSNDTVTALISAPHQNFGCIGSGCAVQTPVSIGQAP